MTHITFDRRIRRKKRISENITGTKEKPRISVFRSNRYIYVQAIDDIEKSTIVSVSSNVFKKKAESNKEKKTIEAKQAGILLAKALKEKKIETGVFDRGMYAYNGRVKALAEGLREGGLKI
ncbi:50S ribosomal protein L18 [Candidatus Roizmanbacteria bacterium]|nr:50S ribosomal protein L18 [Candidatus Roizmanbacteria bacterium]